MAPSESLIEAIPDGQSSPPTVLEDVGHSAANGHGNGHIDGAFDQHALLHALQAMRRGDFSVRLPGDQTGSTGKIADTFNEIVAANERMAQPARTGRPGRRPRGQDPAARPVRAVGRRLGRDGESRSTR